MSIFVCERYLPGVNAEQAVAAADRVRAAAVTLAREGSAARLLSTTFVPDEEWMFDLIEAAGVREVERIYARARVTVERVAKALHFAVDGELGSGDAVQHVKP
jgi:hypothetical protein